MSDVQYESRHDPQDKKAWKVVRCDVEQEFLHTDKDDKRAVLPLPGALEVYLRSEAGYLIVIAWRMPKMIEPAVGGYGGLARWMPLIGGSVTVKR